MSASSGQATVEAVAGIAALTLAGLLCLQLLAVGYVTTLADGAAEAGAIASIRGSSVTEAVRESLPGWGRSRVEVSRRGGLVKVRLRPPAIFRPVAEKLAVTATASGRR